jgi:lactoylglutathione lyase
MRFCWSTLHVSDLAESKDFYTGVIGLKVDREFSPNENMKIAFLSNGDTQIELIEEKGKEKSDIGDDISWGFETESLEDVMKTLEKRNIEIAAGPVQLSPQVRSLFVKDPNGLTVQIVENK